jgi:hypothetical protein
VKWNRTSDVGVPGGSHLSGPVGLVGQLRSDPVGSDHIGGEIVDRWSRLGGGEGVCRTAIHVWEGRASDWKGPFRVGVQSVARLKW